ncbi:hypothetical protein AB0D57_05985 [Streptomyces sp. NPDC048275]|uniref:hypothetical protein n=1 Tax=Streptomyces sp. NPDC048275 TaxID=3155629 RepID=UPI0033FED55F
MTAARPSPADGDMGRAARHDAELGHLLASLREELAEWIVEVADDGPLLKHRSQVESVERILSAGLDRLDGLSGAQRRITLPEVILDLHHVWDFMRGKLLLRRVPRYKDFLDLADELAWSVYDPVRRAAAGARTLKEPPLTFLSREPVAFASPRGGGFSHLLPRGGLRTRGGVEASGQLPFPVIGIPWSASRHLPAVLAVAHETGHHIEDDFALEAPLRARVRAAGLPPDRTEMWERWLDEVFADVCAALACGPAYMWTLADALFAVGDQGGAGADRYPPARLRLLVCQAASTGAVGELPALPGVPDGHDGEAPVVVQALVGDGFEELGGARLGKLIGLTAPEKLCDSVDNLLGGVATGRSDVPGVVAAAALAFVRDPRGYDRSATDSRARREVLRLVPDGPRSAPGGPAELAARDAAAADALLELLDVRVGEHGVGVETGELAW